MNFDNVLVKNLNRNRLRILKTGKQVAWEKTRTGFVFLTALCLPFPHFLCVYLFFFTFYFICCIHSSFVHIWHFIYYTCTGYTANKDNTLQIMHNGVPLTMCGGRGRSPASAEGGTGGGCRVACIIERSGRGSRLLRSDDCDMPPWSPRDVRPYTTHVYITLIQTDIVHLK